MYLVTVKEEWDKARTFERYSDAIDYYALLSQNYIVIFAELKQDGTVQVKKIVL
jgi:hypothetical protein